MDDSTNQNPKKRLPDEEFIRGFVPFFITHQDKSGVVTGHTFAIHSDDETREFSPAAFLEWVMLAHYAVCDNEANNFQDQLIGVINAKSSIKRYIRQFELEKLNYNFQSIFDDLEETKERIETYIKCNLPFKKLNENKQVENPDSNNNTKSIIEKYLEPLVKKAINEKDTPKIIESLQGFFDNKKDLPKNAFFVKHGNRKKLAHALGCIYKESTKEKLSFEYVSFCKSLFEIYSDDIISKNGFNKCRLYTYFHTNKQ